MKTGTPPTTIQSPCADLSPRNEPGLGVTVERLAAELADDGAFSAPVDIPNRAQMRVRLVNVTLVERLDEARSDANVFQNIFWVLLSLTIGVPVAIITNAATISVPSVPQDVLFGSLAVATLVVFAVWRRYAARATAVKRTMLNSEV